MKKVYRRYQVVLVSVISIVAVAAGLLLPFASASCSAPQQHRAGEAEAVERLRALTHAAPPATLPAEGAPAVAHPDPASGRAASGNDVFGDKDM